MFVSYTKINFNSCIKRANKFIILNCINEIIEFSCPIHVQYFLNNSECQTININAKNQAPVKPDFRIILPSQTKLIIH
jgi:hypothetical protein